jgi:putative polyketide hydroxylase
MELLRRWGLEQAAWERSTDVEWKAWACETLAAADQGEAVEVGLPTREQAALVSPTSPACLAQVLGMPWDSSAVPSSEQLKRWIRAAAGAPDLPVEIERPMPVTFGVGLAERFRDGNAFLIGDAAHRVTPRGGTGLNTAIRDGFDVGWKLGWVLRGWADERLLESYEAERRPVAEYNTERSTRPNGSILGTGFGVDADIGGRIAHVWVPHDSGPVSTLDLLGDGLTLFVGPTWDGDAVRIADSASPPLTVERLDAISARGLGLMSADALLTQPDGHPIALWSERQPAGSLSANVLPSGSFTQAALKRPASNTPRSSVLMPGWS